MAGINSFNNNQMIHQNMIKDQIAKSGQNAASHTVSQGNTGVSKQAEKNKPGGVKEESTLSEAAQKAIEQEQLKDASTKGGAEQAGKSAGKKKAKEREKTKDSGGDIRGGGERHHFAPGDQQKLPNGSSIVHGDDNTPSFEIGKTGTKRLSQLDDKNFVQATVLDTMPGHTKAVASKMVEEKTDSGKKREKFADLKMGSDKFSSEVENVITDPTHKIDPRGKVGRAKIRTPKHEKPKMLEDPYAQDIMIEAAKLQAESGKHNDEAFVA